MATTFKISLSKSSYLPKSYTLNTAEILIFINKLRRANYKYVSDKNIYQYLS